MKQKIYIEMRKDPIVEEIRRFRAQHAKRFDNDLDLICEDIKRHQAICGKILLGVHHARQNGRHHARFRGGAGVAICIVFTRM